MKGPGVGAPGQLFPPGVEADRRGAGGGRPLFGARCRAATILGELCGPLRALSLDRWRGKSLFRKQLGYMQASLSDLYIEDQRPMDLFWDCFRFILKDTHNKLPRRHLFCQKPKDILLLVLNRTATHRHV